MSDPDEKAPETDRDDPAVEEGSAGSADPSKTFRENPPDEGEVKEIEEERARRLDAENRPEGVEIDNTGRTFDQDAWEFDDGEGGRGGVVDPTKPASERGHGPDGGAGGEAGGDSGEDDG